MNNYPSLTHFNSSPDFIGIGAARTGSTWIFKNLEQHQDIWIPRIKELHYFSRGLDCLGPSYLAENKLSKRLFSSSGHNKRYRQKLLKSIGSNMLKPSWNKLKWDKDYLLKEPNFEWYLSLFKQGEGKITGEITPAYSVLNDKHIDSLVKQLPNIKIIYILRDPVERAWSLVRYHVKRAKIQRTSLQTDKIYELTLQQKIVAQSNYLENLGRWESHLQKDQLFVGFYDQITDEPKQLISDIYKFLSMDFNTSNVSTDQEKINPSFEQEMPESLRVRLTEKYYPMIEQLSKERGSYFDVWKAKYLEILG